MKRYTITNNQLQKTWVMEMADLHAFYPNGLPEEFKSATIQEEDITQEIAQRVQEAEQAKQTKDALKQFLKSLKSKKLSDQEKEDAIKALIEIVLGA